MLICRVGDEIRLFTGGAETSEWHEDEIAPTRTDFGDALQVGIMAGSHPDAPGSRVEVERFHFGDPDDLAHCATAVAPV